MTTYSVHSDRSGKPLPLAGGYSTPETARRACRKYFEADSNSALFSRSRYWIESDDAPGEPVGKVYEGDDA